MPRRKKHVVLPYNPSKVQLKAFYKYLDNIFLNPKSGGSYSSANKILKEVERRNYYRGVTLEALEKYLQTKPAYTLYKPSVVKFSTPKVRVNTINSQFEIDLMDISRFSSQNDKYMFVLVAIDVLSKFAMGRPLYTKTGAEVAQALEEIIKLRPCKQVSSDKGKEFQSHFTQDMLKRYNIRHFFATSKCPVIERFIRTLRGRIARYMYINKTERFIHDLDNIITGYNFSYHSSIKMRPSSVNFNNAHIAFDNLYGLKGKKPQKPRSYRFDVNDTVRLSGIKRGMFTREFFERWTRETFVIQRRFRMDHINMYHVKDCSGERLVGSFYEPELMKVDVSKFKIEVLEEKTDQNGVKLAKVKYEDFPDKCTEWVLKSTITRA